MVEALRAPQGSESGRVATWPFCRCVVPRPRRPTLPTLPSARNQRDHVQESGHGSCASRARRPLPATHLGVFTVHSGDLGRARHEADAPPPMVETSDSGTIVRISIRTYPTTAPPPTIPSPPRPSPLSPVILSGHV
jgi:hypothetical protein